jgi:hypothetical protein
MGDESRSLQKSVPTIRGFGRAAGAHLAVRRASVLCAGASTSAVFPKRGRVRRTAARSLILSCMLAPTVARAEPNALEMSPKDAAAFRALSASPGGFGRLSGSLELGDGLRFNNPYRLATELGDGAQTVSRTSSYLDLAASYAYGPQRGLAHGFSLHLSLGLEGVKQQVLTPSYLAEVRRSPRWAFSARLGTPIVLTPDPTFGFELAAGCGYFVTSRIAVHGELVGDLFYGAGTLERRTTTYPVLSGQLGLLFEQELLPW